MPARLLIHGYGNPLRGDDAFGWLAATQLAARCARPDVDIRALHQLTPELAEPIGAALRVIFIDAARDGLAGVLQEETVQPRAASGFTHQLTPATLLALARQLYGRAPAATLYSVAGECFDYREGLSTPVEAALGALCRKLAAECDDAGRG
jgi:hydrogenase maturation protease